MAFDALIATAKPRLLASVRRQATQQTIGALIGTSGVWDLMKARGIKSTGHNVVVYWDERGRDLMHAPNGIPVDIGAEIEAPFESDAELSCTTTPAGRFISVLHIGPVDRLGDAYDAIFAHVRAHNLKLAGPYWEYYGHWSEDPATFEASVSYALA
jgi:effector-binding domain-containing protein